jgi:predicted HTH transcriptional regulator
MALHPILKSISGGESDTLDFKKTISSASKIAKTMVSFANHKGGTLLIGVNDSGTLAGVKSEDEIYMLGLAGGFYCKPEIQPEIREWEIGGKLILEAFIPEGNDKPYYAKDEEGKWWAYIRVKDKSLLASKVVLDVLKRNSSGKDVAVAFSRHEMAMLKYLRSNEKITVKEVCKLLNISRWRAQKMLVNLVSIGAIRNHTTEKAEYFTLS